jgi:diacylglycerol kinase (ATP)
MVMKETQLNPRFSIIARFNSIKYALRGIKGFFIAEHNAFMHMVATLLVIILSLLFGVTNTEAMLIMLVVCGVWASELFNTAIEKIADMVTTEIHPVIKLVKDLSAGAVFVTAMCALIIGMVIFLPKILSFL